MESPIPATTAVLDALLSAGQQNVLNVVESLQNGGIDDIIPLPQLVLCGDQLSGKNSVLEAITEILFRGRENPCTQFATKSVLCRLPESFLTTEITSHKTRPAKEQAELPNCKLSIRNFDEPPALIESATKAIDIGDKNLEKEVIKWQPQVDRRWLVSLLGDKKAVATLLKFLKTTGIRRREGATER